MESSKVQQDMSKKIQGGLKVTSRGFQGGPRGPQEAPRVSKMGLDGNIRSLSWAKEYPDHVNIAWILINNHSFEAIEILRVFSSKLKAGERRWSHLDQVGIMWKQSESIEAQNVSKMMAWRHMMTPKMAPRCSQGGTRDPQQGPRVRNIDLDEAYVEPKCKTHAKIRVKIGKQASTKTIKILRVFSKLKLGEPRWSQYGPSWHQMRSNMQHGGTSWPKVEGMTSMMGPKTIPRCSQGGSRGPQQGSKAAQDDPVWHQQDPKLGQHESQT